MTNNNSNRKEIGTVSISYDINGVPIQAIYKPEAYPIDENCLKAMQLPDPEDTEKVKQSAEMILSKYWSSMTDVELADREKYKIVAEADCPTKHENGKASLCVIKFFLEEIK